MTIFEVTACVALAMSLMVLLDRRSLIQELRRTRKEVKHLRRSLDAQVFKRRSISRQLREAVIDQCEYTCQYCGRRGKKQADPDGKPWHIDHVIPVAKGGPTHIGNLTLACQRCNLGKGANTPVSTWSGGTDDYAAQTEPTEAEPVEDPIDDLLMDGFPKLEKGEPPTPEMAALIRAYYLRTNSKSATCRRFYGYKDGETWQLVRSALENEHDMSSAPTHPSNMSAKCGPMDTLEGEL